MATITYTPVVTGNSQLTLTSWGGLTAGDDGSPYPFGGYADRSVQVFGAFGVGGKVVIEGSHDNLNWTPLHDAFGNIAELTAPGILLLAEASLYTRPRVTAGDGSTALTVLMLGRTA